MKDFKEIAEKCLRGELSGTFILRNDARIPSRRLYKRTANFIITDPYVFNGLPYTYSDTGTRYPTYEEEYDVINFIPDNMSKFNFKDIAEKCIDGKLKGNFVLRNKNLVNSSKLFKNNSSTSFPYSLILGDEGRYITYNHQGSRFTNTDNELDIINFIPDMEERNVKLTLEKAKEWYKKGGELKEVALQAYTEEELKVYRPKSWEEYCIKCGNENPEHYFISSNSKIDETHWISMLNPEKWRGVLPTKELAEAFRAYMQLISLRQAWIGDWKPDVKAHMYGIVYAEEGIRRQGVGVYVPLSFPTKEMTDDFINCFKDLLEVAKPLI